MVTHIRLDDNYFSDIMTAPYKPADNYFNDQTDQSPMSGSNKKPYTLLQTLSKNFNLLEISLKRNRLPHGCLSKIKNIVTRNKRKLGEDEPNRLKREIYRLRWGYHKLEQARDQLRKEHDESV